MTKVQIRAVWPAKYKVWRLDVHESEGFDNWLLLAELRKVLPELRKDAELQAKYPGDIRLLDSSKRLFINEQAILTELGSVQSHAALLFLAWFDKTIAYPARRKRGAHLASPSLEQQGRGHAEGDPGPDMSSLQSSLAPATPPVEEGRGVLRQFAQLGSGQRDLGETLIAGGMLTLAYEYIVEWVIVAVGNPSNYQGDFALRVWVIFLAILMSAIVPLWWGLATMRCALRYQREGRNAFLPFLAFVGAACFLLNAGATALASGGEWVLGWFDLFADVTRVATVVHDPILGRLVLRGELGFGSYKALQKALAIQPHLKLIQLDSPGGYVLEGMAMAKLIQANGMDTVSLEHCASACTLLLAAGKERYLGPEAEIGFHRSRIFGKAPSSGWAATDYRMADYYRSRGTSDSFIAQALETPSSRIWIPEGQQMLEAGYVTRAWSERKQGY